MRVSCSEHRHHATFYFVCLRGASAVLGQAKESVCSVTDKLSAQALELDSPGLPLWLCH